MGKALGVVPTYVKLRVLGMLVVGVFALAGLVHLLVQSSPGWLWTLPAAVVLLGSFGLCGYGLWCLWSSWLWGTTPLGKLRPSPGLTLTFDDGPTPGLTDRILDLLQQSQTQASFFLLVHKAKKHPDLVQRIHREGHQVGLHGLDHRGPFFRSRAELAASLREGKEELEALIGEKVTLYRPSFGWKTWALVGAVRQVGLSFCFWDYGIWDTDAPLWEVLFQRMRSVTAQGRSGPVLLLHDGRGDDEGIPAHGEVLLLALSEWLKTHRWQLRL